MQDRKGFWAEMIFPIKNMAKLCCLWKFLEIHFDTHVKCLNAAHLHEYDYGDDGIADGEDAPEHPNGLAVPHELVGVVVRRLPVLQLRLHIAPNPLPCDAVVSEKFPKMSSEFISPIFLGSSWISG